MMVYVLSKGERGEGSTTFAVFDTLGKAKKRGADHAKGRISGKVTWESVSSDKPTGNVMSWKVTYSNNVDFLLIERLKVE